MMLFRAATSLLAFLCALPVAAQVAGPDSAQTCMAVSAAGLPGISGRRDDYVRAMSLRGSEPANVLIRRPSYRRRGVVVPCDEPWRVAVSAEDVVKSTHTVAGSFDAIFNSGYPYGTQTGLLWPGRGVHMLWTAGADYSVGPLHLGFYPQLAYHQNRAFPIVPFPGDSGSMYAYPWARSAGGHPRIDWPQRHGDESFGSASLGQSFLSLEVAGVRGGVSTENLWWGPALRNSILLGNDAPGFPHAFIGTPRGIGTPVGRVAAEIVWGRLTESDYFDSEPDDDHRFITGIIVSVEPRGATGLVLGAARLYYKPYDDVGISDLLPFLETPFKNRRITADNPRGEDVADQMIGFYARYAIPRTGFEVYGEWARNDHSADLRDFYTQPDHSRAYTLGFQQVIAGGARWYRLRGEINQLGAGRTATTRPIPTYYVHHLVTQGYTHKGQLLGAAIGPGADAQFLGFDVVTGRGSHGLFIERVRYNEDAYYTFVAPTYGPLAHEVELTGGTTHLMRFGRLEVSLGLSYSSRGNRTFRYCSPLVLGLRDCRLPAYRDSNWHLPIGMAWVMN
jgi:hypothetical protein